MAYDFNSLTKQADEASNRDKFYTDFGDVDPNKLHQISELTNWMRTKAKGSDVREIIAQLFERTWLENIKEGNANMEVAKARGTAATLGDRLDAMTSDIDGKASAKWVEKSLNNILSTTPKASLASLEEIQSTYPNGANGIVVARDSGKWYYWSDASKTWTEGGTYQSRVIGENEVTADNVDFVQGIQQMLVQKVDGAPWWWNNNSITTFGSANWARYMPINLIKGKTYYIYNARGYFSYIVSADGTRCIKQLSTRDTLVTTEYTATEDSLLYISTDVSKNDKAPKVFNASIAELKSAQVDFNNLPDGYVTLSIPKLSLDVKAEDLKFVNLVKQLLDEATLVKGVYYTGNKAETLPEPTWAVYPPIYLTPGKTYGLQNVRGFFTYFFNNNDQLVKKFATVDGLITEDFTPEEYGYLLITRRLVDDPSKLILGGLSKAHLLPSLDYGASAFESEISFISPVSKTDFTVKKDGSGDFTSLVTAIDAVGEGTSDKPINIYVHSGTYDILAELGGDSWLQTVETTNSERQGIIVPNYVNIIGVGDVRLQLEVPDNKTTANTAKRISVLNLWRHNTIKNIKITFCKSLHEQQKRASILSAYDSQIENNQKRIKLLEQMAENLYKEWFVRFRFPGYETAEFEGGVPKGWVSLVGDNKKPKGWTYGELNQLGTFIRGKNITAAEMIEGQVPVISAGLEPAGYHNQANVCGPCLTISSSGANAGYLKYNLTDIWAADCSYYNNPDNIWFVYSSLKYLQPVISNLQCGAAQPHVYPKDVNRLCVILPPKSLITEYNRQSSLFFKNIHNLKNQIFLLTHQRDLLLPRLMSGKLSI